METSAFVVPRQDVRAIHSVEIDGVIHDIGENRDFRRNALLAAFLPSSGRISISWARLTAGQELAVHEHPTKSVIVIARGGGALLGSAPRVLHEGDIVAVPVGAPHGFTTDSELVVLSIQFEGAGLYEDEVNPRVEFSGRLLERFIRYQDERVASYLNTPIFRMLNDGTLEDPQSKARFLACLHQWSSVFQRMMFLRQGLTYGAPWEAMFLQHFHEELGHDNLLAKEVGIATTGSDAILDACASWFLHRTMVGDNLERLVIVHSVLERGAHEFHTQANKLFPSAYFDAHASADDAHHNLGMSELDAMDMATYERLLETSKKAWDMLEALLDRIAEIVNEAREGVALS